MPRDRRDARERPHQGDARGGCDRRAGRRRPGRRGRGPDTVTGARAGPHLGRLGRGPPVRRPRGRPLWGGVGHDLSWGDDGDDLMGGGWQRRPARRPGQRHDLRRARAATRRSATTATTTCGRGRAATCTAQRHARGHAARRPGQRHVPHARRRAGQIDCGPDVDTAYLDFKDVIVDATAQNPNGSCEVVNRERRGKKGDDAPRRNGTAEDVSGTEHRRLAARYRG